MEKREIRDLNDPPRVPQPPLYSTPRRDRRIPAFRKVVRELLATRTARLHKVLTRYINHRYPPDFWKLEFELDQSAAWDVQVIVHFYKPEYDQVYDHSPEGRKYPFGTKRFLWSATRILTPKLARPFADTEEELWPMEIVDDELIPWFARVWNSAGGRKFPYAATIGDHDAAARYDLMRRHWIDARW